MSNNYISVSEYIGLKLTHRHTDTHAHFLTNNHMPGKNMHNQAILKLKMSKATKLTDEGP